MTEVLSLLKDRGVIPYSEKGNIGNKKSEDTTRYKIVRPDDIVMNCMNVIIGSVGRSDYTGCLSPVYYVLKRRTRSDNPRYLDAYCQHKPFQRSLVRLGKGIMAHRMRIPMELLKGEPFPHPPPDEQAAIVKFLGHANRKIGRYIQAKRKLIKLLDEQKQAIIYGAVTQGIDAASPLKTSGVEWLPEVPKHWSIVPSKALFSHRKTKALPGDPMLTASQAHGIIPRDQFIAEHGRVMPVIIGADILKRVEPNDFVISMRSFQGGLEWSHVQGAISSAYVMLVPKESVFPAFFAYLFKSRPYILALRRTSDLVRDGQALRFANFAQIPLPLVPLGEQRRIARHLDQATTEIVQAQAAAKKEIELLSEYRTRLTADVVTGKLDVREAAAKLPDLASDDDLTEADLDLADEVFEEDDS